MLYILLLASCTLAQRRTRTETSTEDSTTATSTPLSTSSTTTSTSSTSTTDSTTSTTRARASSTESSITPTSTPIEHDICVAVGDNAVCNPYAAFNLDLTQLSKTYPGQSPLGLALYDDFLKSSAPRTDSFYQNLTNSCPGSVQDIVQSTRYLSSFFCFRDIAVNSKPVDPTNLCNKNQGVPGLCSQTCTALTASLAIYFKANPGKCASSFNASLFISQIAAQCSEGSLGESANCVKSISAESSNCGFKSSASAQSYCSSNADPCCSLLTSSASTALSSGAIAGIAIGVLLLTVLILGGIFLLVRRSGKHQENAKFVQSVRPATLERQTYPSGYELNVLYTAQFAHNPQFEDELLVNVGDQVVLEAVYEDGEFSKLIIRLGLWS